MDLIEQAAAARYDGCRGDELADRAGLPYVAVFASVGSTLDVAHALAEQGAEAGTLVVADAQTAGRGRHGRSWQSEPGAGIWLTLVERPADAAALDVLSLRIGLRLAEALDAFAAEPVRLKWPNDLYVGGEKLAGILIEARWREGVPEWVAIGVGINVRRPAGVEAAALRDGVNRVDALLAAVAAIRQAAQGTGQLDEAELAAFAARDLATGRRCIEPADGEVAGIDPGGALLVRVDAAPMTVVAMRAGSLIFKEAP